MKNKLKKLKIKAQEQRYIIQVYEDKYNDLVKIDTSEAMDYFHEVLTPARRLLLDIINDTHTLKCKIDKEAASPLNKTLFNEAIAHLDTHEDKPNTWHWGKVDIGKLINYLEENYTITKKDQS